MKHSILLVVALTASVANADTLIFDDGGAGTLVGTADNWDPDQVPTAADDLVIGATFASTGNLGGVGTQANTVLVEGSHSSTWGLVAFTIDGGSVTLAGAGAPFGGAAGSANLLKNGTLTFRNKNAAEVVSQYGGNISVAGSAAVFGSDPLAVEPGDNALIVENAEPGADDVTVQTVVPEPAATLEITGILILAGGDIEIRWEGAPGDFSVEYSFDLKKWEELTDATIPPDQNSAVIIDDLVAPLAANTRVYYRVLSIE